MMSIALLDLDLKEIDLPFTANNCVLLFVVKPRSEKSYFVFGLRVLSIILVLVDPGSGSFDFEKNFT